MAHGRMVGDQLGMCGGERADDLGERQVGQRRLGSVDATAEQHREPGCRSALDRLRHQPRLAHSGVPRQQHAGGPAGGGTVERGGECRDLGPSPNQPDPDPQPRHAGHPDMEY
jgi:hypothetical protein